MSLCTSKVSTHTLPSWPCCWAACSRPPDPHNTGGLGAVCTQTLGPLTAGGQSHLYLERAIEGFAVPTEPLKWDQSPSVKYEQIPELMQKAYMMK